MIVNCNKNSTPHMGWKKTYRCFVSTLFLFKIYSRLNKNNLFLFSFA
jgi:hypothetical protein